jgi:hypothetical protein
MYIDYGISLVPIEIKSSTTFNPRFSQRLEYYMSLVESGTQESSVVYGGDADFTVKQISVVSWKNTEQLVR